MVDLMSSTSRCDSSYDADVEELLQLTTMRKETLDSDANAASEARLKDEEYIGALERELSNCSQEIGYLQDQLNLRSVESNFMGEHVHCLELKLAEVGTLHEKLRLLTEERVQSDSKRLLLMREINNKEEELHKSAFQIERLETTISTIALESQCEIESMKIEITALEERCFEAERFSYQTGQEKAKLDALLEELESQLLESQGTICCLEKENKELKEKVMAYEQNTKKSNCKVEEHLDHWVKRNSQSLCLPGGSIDDLLVELRKEVPFLKEICTCDATLCFSESAVVDDTIKDEMEKMSNQIYESELLVAQLKEELREEKLKAKEEAEDLTQAMAELRYQITGMLEEECKRRACIEQTSLRRIQDLEEEVRNEQKKSFAAIRRYQEVHQLAEMRSKDVRQLKKELEGFRRSTNSDCIEESSDYLSELCSDGDTLNDTTDGSSLNQPLLEWYPDDKDP